MATISRDFEVHLEADRIVRVSVDEPCGVEIESPTVVFIPGFKGFKDWGGWPWFCGQVAAAGHRVARINPSMCGVGAGLDVFDEPERFARQTLAHDVEDVVALLQHPEMSGSRILLLGHSRGGLVAALAANPCSGVAGIITMGTPDQLLRLTDEEINRWLESGIREIVNARTGETLVQDRVVLEDFMQQGDRHGSVDKSPLQGTEWLASTHRCVELAPVSMCLTNRSGLPGRRSHMMSRMSLRCFSTLRCQVQGFSCSGTLAEDWSLPWQQTPVQVWLESSPWELLISC